ncbi:MAG: peptidoglycan DD-metalloendopeptidase family protein [Elusimicrobia bacterium]|nr:peptidoglycan DD-metalloendopeptidase family protein [Elusimicrobiota bacterium]
MDLRHLALAALLLGLPGAADAGELEEKKQDLTRIQKEYEKTKSELEAYRRQEASLSRDLRKLASHDSDTRRRLGAIRRNIHEAENKRTVLKSRLGALNLASGFWSTALERELRDYAAALASRDEAWGGGGLWAEAFRRALLQDKVRMVASLRGSLHKTEAAAEAARYKAVELKDRGRQAEAEAAQVRQEFERTQAAVTEARGRVEAAQKRARELEETKIALAQLLARLGAAARDARQGPAALELPRHSLPWPVEGVVAKPFGRQRNPELNTWVIRQGVTLSAPAGAGVAAVGAGRVIYSGVFRSYGQVVILDHGGGFFSIYGELGEILKPKGSSVATGEVLGRVAGGAGKGPVYLELRRGTEALDPLDWLRQRP